ncbi:MAG: DUF4129 domain-containing protein [Ferruginibacter sp.]
MHKIIYILFSGISFLSAAQAQDKTYAYQDTVIKKEAGKIEQVPVEDHTLTSNYENERPDTALYKNTLDFPADSVQYWKNLKEFAYAKYLDSLLKDKQKKQVKKKPGLQGPGLLNSFLTSPFLRVMLWTLAVLFILFVLYRLFLAEGVFKRESRSAKQQTPEVEEEVITSESDFDNLINQALQNNNYRQAVRYQYLRTLHKLADKNLVELARDKTNFQYVREIKNPAFQNDFASLTLNYEYVWYGEFMIDRNIYQKIDSNFTELNQKL